MTNILWAKAPSGRIIDIPILGVCGEFGSGKTLFGASIAPGNHPEGHPYAGKPRTGIIDVEMSSATYEGSALGFERFDLPAMLMKNRSGGFTPIELFEACRKLIDSIPNERFDVLMIDPVTDIDSGLTDYVRANCTKFGLTTRQLEKSSGLLWGVVKNQWNNWLLQIAQKCKTFVFTAHMRDHYIGNMPSGKREPKGKETLGKLASIYLELNRKPGKDGTVPKAPTARIIKGRLCDMFIDAEGDIQNIELLPPVFENCTPKRIRQFIQSPPTEKVVVPEGHLDNDMKLAFQALIETQRNEANQAELQLLDRQKELRSTLPTAPIPKPETTEKVVNVEAVTRSGEAQKFTVSPLKAVSLPSVPIPNVPPVVAPVEVVAAPPESAPAPLTEQAATSEPSNEPPFEVDKISKEEMVSHIKKSHGEKLFTSEEFKMILDDAGAAKLSELSNDQVEELYRNVCRMESIAYMADSLGVPRSKLDELAKMAGDKTAFVSKLKTKLHLHELLSAQMEERDKKDVF